MTAAIDRKMLRMVGLWVRVTLLTAALPLACVSGDREICFHGQTASCACDGGRGMRVCDSDGQWGGCDCSSVRPYLGACLCENGCCDIGACRVGNVDEACGGDRQACLRCGEGELCVGRACVAAPATGLTLRVVSASVPSFDPLKPGCSSWDCLDPTGSAPDVFVRERTGRFRTAVAWDLYTPVWDEAVATGLTPEQLAEPLVLDVVDDDSVDAELSAQLFIDPPLPSEYLIARFEIRLRPEQRVPGRLVFTSGTSTASLVYLTLELR